VRRATRSLSGGCPGCGGDTAMHRSRAAAASKFSALVLFNGAHIFSRASCTNSAIAQPVEIFRPSRPSRAVLLHSDLGLPFRVELDGAGVEPVAGVLPQPVGRHFAQLLEGHSQGARTSSTTRRMLVGSAGRHV